MKARLAAALIEIISLLEAMNFDYLRIANLVSSEKEIDTKVIFL